MAGNHCYVSGQLAVDRDGVFQRGSAREEATLAFENILNAVAATGFSRDEIVYVDIAFIDLADVPEVNELFGELFPEPRRPARTIYQAAALPYGGRVKIQAIAVRES